MAQQHIYFVYILASRLYGTLYIGVTNDLHRRMLEHRDGRVHGFTKRYRVTKLMYFEEFVQINDAIQREKSLKEWPRAWKINLIERDNPMAGSVSCAVRNPARPCTVRHQRRNGSRAQGPG